MSVPIHNLYDFVHHTTEKMYRLYYFYPHGFKKIENLMSYYETFANCNKFDKKFLEEEFKLHPIYKSIFPESYNGYGSDPMLNLQPTMICHDQEPLMFDLYTDDNLEGYKHYEMTKLNLNFSDQNLRACDPFNWYKKCILLHSELNSQELNKYEQSNFVGAFWWSHAAIALDWYRYAKHDFDLQQNCTNYEKLFLVYSRDMSGSRAYRANFLNRLQKLQINDSCVFSNTNNNSDSSATYAAQDFLKTAISVVLETVFDERIHLTEKTLRPIACGHPFIVANGPGSLDFLRRYGFKTFSPYINESYDQIQDTDQRMQAILLELKRLQSLPKEKLIVLLAECYKIADHNKNLFFSNEFFSAIEQELKTSVATAWKQVREDIDWKKQIKIRAAKKLFNNKKYRSGHHKSDSFYIIKFFLHLRKGGTLENYVPPLEE